MRYKLLPKRLAQAISLRLNMMVFLESGLTRQR